ncbi:MAG: ABC transporter permease [Christensenellales bacterium]
MISFPLIKREIKANYKLFLIFAAVLAMYITVINVMFDPALGNMLQEFAKAMPEMMAAFGMVTTGGTLIEFVSSYLYGMLMLIFPMIFVIILANKLVAKYVDKGSMAYLLATPNTRKKIVLTQAVFLVLNVAVLMLFVTVVGIIACEAMFPGQLDIPKFIYLNIGAFCLHMAISGLCFFASCIANDTKLSYSIGAGVSITFYLMLMLANMGGKLESLKYATIFTLYDTNKIISGDSNAIWMCAVLFVAGVVLYGIGIRRFIKKDLTV